ncbi:MAG: cytochrome-c oxidase, cbb3-type subunit II [bacterium]|nr:cytochrome-c oxidase, cbb3-type subunit II [bacterium]
MFKALFHAIERRPFWFGGAIFALIVIGGIVEVIPSFFENSRPIQGEQPYTALQLTGRQVYIQESCNACHSQLIRPFKAETDRYGAFSKSGEYAYDRPFLWGSKRTGPDLLRVGNYRTTDWHEAHFERSSSVSPGTNMPNFPWLFEEPADLETAFAEMLTVKQVYNVPYDQPGQPPLGDLEQMKQNALREAEPIVAAMKSRQVKEAFAQGEIKQVVALIAYLNSLK